MPDLHYTLHQTPLARADSRSLAQMSMDSFLGRFPHIPTFAQDTYTQGENEGLQVVFTDPATGMAYAYRTFMYGNIQFQLLVSQPYTQAETARYTQFFDSLRVQD